MQSDPVETSNRHCHAHVREVRWTRRLQRETARLRRTAAGPPSLAWSRTKPSPRHSICRLPTAAPAHWRERPSRQRISRGVSESVSLVLHNCHSFLRRLARAPISLSLRDAGSNRRRPATLRQPTIHHGSSRRRLTVCRNSAAGAPSIARWSKVRLRNIVSPLAISPLEITGFSTTRPTPSIPT